jgi:hypothetical protein
MQRYVKMQSNRWRTFGDLRFVQPNSYIFAQTDSFIFIYIDKDWNSGTDKLTEKKIQPILGSSTKLCRYIWVSVKKSETIKDTSQFISHYY